MPISVILSLGSAELRWSNAEEVVRHILLFHIEYAFLFFTLSVEAAKWIGSQALPLHRLPPSHNISLTSGLLWQIESSQMPDDNLQLEDTFLRRTVILDRWKLLQLLGLILLHSTLILDRSKQPQSLERTPLHNTFIFDRSKQYRLLGLTSVVFISFRLPLSTHDHAWTTNSCSISPLSTTEFISFFQVARPLLSETLHHHTTFSPKLPDSINENMDLVDGIMLHLGPIIFEMLVVAFDVTVFIKQEAQLHQPRNICWNPSTEIFSVRQNHNIGNRGNSDSHSNLRKWIKLSIFRAGSLRLLSFVLTDETSIFAPRLPERSDLTYT